MINWERNFELKDMQLSISPSFAISWPVIYEINKVQMITKSKI